MTISSKPLATWTVKSKPLAPLSLMGTYNMISCVDLLAALVIVPKSLTDLWLGESVGLDFKVAFSILEKKIRYANSQYVWC